MADNRPILVTGAGGKIGGVSNFIIDILLLAGERVRGFMRSDDERAAKLRSKGVDIIIGDLTEITDLHRAVGGCKSVYFSMSVDSAYLEAALHIIAVAKHHNIGLFVNMSQDVTLLVTVEKTLKTHQTRSHWIVEQALKWSGVPHININPSIFMEIPFLHLFTPQQVAGNNEFHTTLKPEVQFSPISAYDVGRVAAKLLLNPAPYMGKSLPLVGPKIITPVEFAKGVSEAVGRELKFVYDDQDQFFEQVKKAPGVDGRIPHHLNELCRVYNVPGEVQRGQLEGLKEYEKENLVEKITGTAPIGVAEWARKYSEFK